MNNEIKEILDYLDYCVNNLSISKPPKIGYEDIKTLLDYITNLQQENERLKRRLATKKLFKKYKVEKDENFELRKIFELQRRIEKAIEFIKLCKEETCEDSANYVDNDYALYNLLNILK